MEKLTDIVILYHKEVPYGLWDNEIFTPLEVGAALREPVYDFGLRDNEGDNISEWNLLFAETTGIYWNWKHLTGKKYAGQVQYRRRVNIESIKELDKIFSQYRVIAACPLTLSGSVKQNYAACHNAGDLEWIKEIVHRLYPEYDESWDKYIENGRLLFYSNGFIMEEEDYAKYCEWLFSILFEYKRLKQFETVEDVKAFTKYQIENGLRPKLDSNGKPDNALNYQSQICGFLSERLWTLYLLHNFNRKEIAVAAYMKMENCL